MRISMLVLMVCVIGMGIQPRTFMRSARLEKSDKTPGADWIRNTLKKLSRGRIDAAHSPEPGMILYYSKQLNLRDHIKVLTLPEKPIEFIWRFQNLKGQEL